MGDRYFDQLVRNGHDRRIDDLDRFAALGIRTLRYPVLWERTAPDGLDDAEWTWADERLTRLRALGVRPIVGLLHHGSGPRDTSLVDPRFPERFAAYAGAVAARYPWVDAYTPVNEPLTTARFSGLYGHWYPHGRDERTLYAALLGQVRATVLAMRAIRAVRPDATLIQSEDLGWTHAREALAYQAEFENERRWLGFDLLCGRVVPGHRFHAEMVAAGIDAGELAWLADHPCPPDVIGGNYYLTSERLLDGDLAAWPAWSHGGNGLDRYADVHSVLAGILDGPARLLERAWRRYQIPLAITEAHLGATREEQLRWLDELWGAAEGVRALGADVRAVTVWSLLGTFDWHCLVTREEGFYEPGVFDVRGSAPRPTALAAMVRALAAGVAPSHPVLAGPGAWRRATARVLEDAA